MSLAWLGARWRGAAIPLVLAILVVASALLLGAGYVVQASLRPIAQIRERADFVRRVREIYAEALAALAADPTPEAHSREDPLFKMDGVERDGLKVSVKDVSSALNPNWLSRDFMADPAVADLFVQGFAPDDLIKRRKDLRFPVQVDVAYADFLDPEEGLAAFSGYALMNPDLTDPDTFLAFVAAAGATPSGESAYRAAWERRRRTQPGPGEEPEPWSMEQLATVLGVPQETLSWAVTSLPPVNVNLASRETIEALFYYDWGIGQRLPAAQSAVALLAQTRELREVKAADLPLIVGAPDGSLVYRWLGVKTQRVRVEVSGARPYEREELILSLPE